jgi:predicted kinase
VLIVVAGLPGSGKSTMAVDLGRALSCAVLGVDQAEAAMWRAGVSQSAPTHHAAYLVVAALAAEQLALGTMSLSMPLTDQSPPVLSGGISPVRWMPS